MYSIWGDYCIQGRSHAVTSSNICATRCTTMRWSTLKRLVQKTNASFSILPPVKAWLLMTYSTTCYWSGHIFGASANPRSFTKKRWWVTLFHCSWWSAWYQICDIRFPIVCGIRGWRNLGVYHLTSSYCFSTAGVTTGFFLPEKHDERHSNADLLIDSTVAPLTKGETSTVRYRIKPGTVWYVKHGGRTIFPKSHSTPQTM